MQLRHLWNGFVNAISRNLEPEITEKHDRLGHTYFQVYDPANHKTSTLNSEQEVRAWLDQRHDW
jgi:hypothetical protein